MLRLYMLSYTISIVLLIVLNLAAVHGGNGWGVTCGPLQICALKGSAVTINCSYEYPLQINGKNTEVGETFWFIKQTNYMYVDLKTDPTFSNRVQYHCVNHVCQLSITDLRESDSAEYKFRFTTNYGKYTGLPGVTLSVTDPQLQVIARRSTDYQYPPRTELTCHSDCQLPDSVSYIWFKNKKRLKENKRHILQQFDNADAFYCALEEYAKFPSLAAYVSTSLFVSVSHFGEILEDSSVTLTCRSNTYQTPPKYTWYKKHGSQDFQQLSKEQQHVFSSIKPSDSGVYYCLAKYPRSSISSSLEINVKYGPKFSSVSVSPSGPVEEGKPLNLTCSSDANPAAYYSWYKDNKFLSWSRDVNFPFITSEDRGNYLCMSENRYGQLNSSSLFVDVLYAPKLASVSASLSGDIVEGSPLNLTCSSDANPAANYTWYKQDAPDLPFVLMSPSGNIMEGSSVTLTCSSDANPAAEYTWYKQEEKSPKISGQNITINNIKHEHSGNYSCKVHNRLGHKNSTVHVAVVEAAWKSVVTGTSVMVLIILIILVLVFFLMKKRKPSGPSSEHGKRPDTSEQCEPHQSEEQKDLHYASVRLMRNPNDCLYMNTRSNGACRLGQEENESVEYSMVNYSPR
ncbi:B-cell receptor CD22-like [Nematolebias whitei]|uniref:B-cell receptor CD22-like n=1 Tax=Nematolebias whitei TaxID=451745 RepID=UPI00189AB9A2|nr:B-cell receptor CD22-like [Nematolebias whitei]